jgi:hypothetical protein
MEVKVNLILSLRTLSIVLLDKPKDSKSSIEPLLILTGFTSGSGKSGNSGVPTILVTLLNTGFLVTILGC